MRRCLTLADALTFKGASCEFICPNTPEILRAEIRRRGHQLSILKYTERSESTDKLAYDTYRKLNQTQDANDTVQSLSGDAWDWMIVDHYSLDVRWESIIQTSVDNIMVIDDLADRSHHCKLLLDQNFVANMNTRYSDKVNPDCQLLLGPSFALLHGSYAETHDSVTPRSAVKRILIYFGGADLIDLTRRTLQVVLTTVSDAVEVDVVMPVDPTASEKIESLARDHERVTCHHDLDTLAPLMASADLSIGALGATTWERLCVGLPTVAVTTAENQKEVASALDEAELVIWLGDGKDATPELIEKALSRVLDTDSLSSWSTNCKQLCDGRGTARVVRKLLEHIENH